MAQQDPPDLIQTARQILGQRSPPQQGPLLRTGANVLGIDTTGTDLISQARGILQTPSPSVSMLLDQPSPMQEAGEDGFLDKLSRFGTNVATGLVESVNVFERDISNRERLGRAATIGSFFVPFGITAKAFKAASLAPRMLATGAQEAVIGGSIAALRDESITGHAAFSAGVGAGLEGIFTRGRLRRARKAHEPATRAFREATPETFTSLKDSPLRTQEYAIVSAQRSGADAALNVQRTKALVQELQNRGFDPIPVQGFRPLRASEDFTKRAKEDSFIIPGMTDAEAIELGIRFNQKSVITRKGLLDLEQGRIQELDPWGLKFDAAVNEGDDFFSAVKLRDEVSEIELNKGARIVRRDTGGPSATGIRPPAKNAGWTLERGPGGIPTVYDTVDDALEGARKAGLEEVTRASDQPSTLFSLRFADEWRPLHAGPATTPLIAKYTSSKNDRLHYIITKNTKQDQTAIMEKVSATGEDIPTKHPDGSYTLGWGSETPGWRAHWQVSLEDVREASMNAKSKIKEAQDDVAHWQQQRVNMEQFALNRTNDESFRQHIFNPKHRRPLGRGETWQQRLKQEIDEGEAEALAALEHLQKFPPKVPDALGEVGPWKAVSMIGDMPVGHTQFRTFAEAQAFARDNGYTLTEKMLPPQASLPVMETSRAISEMIQAEPSWRQRFSTRARNIPWAQKLHLGYQAIMDKWHGFDVLDQAASGLSWRKLDTIPVQQSVRAAAQLMGGFASIAEHNLKYGLIPINRNSGQAIRPGLYELVQRNLTEEEFDSFIQYGFARRWLAVEKTGKQLPPRPDGSGHFTSEELQDLLDHSPEHFAKTFDQIVDWRNTLLKEYLGNTGVLSRKAVKAILSSEDYVPLRRAMDEIIERVNIESPENFFGVFSPVKELKGMGPQFQNWFHVLEKETVLFTQLASQQIVLNRLVNNLRRIDPGLVGQFARRVRKPKLQLGKIKTEAIAQIKQSDPALAEAVATLDTEILSLLAPNIMLSGRPTIGALVRGKRQHWEITDPLLWDSVKSLGPMELNWFEKLLANPASRGAASMFRAGTVLGLEFMARNPLRDITWAAATAGAHPVNFLRGIASAVKGDEWFKLWMAGAGPRAALVSMDRKVLREQFAAAMTNPGNALTNVVRHPIDALRAFSELMESGTRLGQFRSRYEHYLSKGLAPQEALAKASLDSRNVSVDFAVHGSKVSALRLASAFWNPMLQSWRELGTRAIRDPAGVAIRSFIGITIPSMLLYFANTRGDSKLREEYLNLPPWEKMLFWHVRTGDHWTRVPRPFELGIVFGLLPEKMFEAIDAEDPTILDKAWAETAQDIAKNFIPVPTLLRPFGERIANYDFFRERRLIPRGEEEVDPKFRETAGTSDVAKQIVRMLHLNDLGIDPITVDHFLRSYTGGMGMLGTDIADGLYRAATDAPVQPGYGKVGPFQVPMEPTEMPLARGFVSRFPANNEATERFYRFASEVRKASRTASSLERELRLDDLEDFLEQKGQLLAFSSDVEAVMQQLTELRHQRTQIRNDPNLDGITKQELIDQIVDAEYRIAIAAADMENSAKELVFDNDNE